MLGSPVSTEGSLTSNVRTEDGFDSGGVGYGTEAELCAPVSLRDVCSCGRRGTSKSLPQLDTSEEARWFCSIGTVRSVDSR